MIVYGIDAIAVGPGSVKTPIWGKAEEKTNKGPYDNTRWKDPIDAFVQTMSEGGATGLEPEVISKVIKEALTAKKPKARYAPVPDKLTNFTIASRLPKRTLDKIFWKRFGLKPPT